MRNILVVNQMHGKKQLKNPEFLIKNLTNLKKIIYSNKKEEGKMTHKILSQTE